jgi:N-acyl-D-amino-acid deacylase
MMPDMKTLLARAAATVALLVLPVVAGAQTPAPTYDVVIRNGRVLDGAGNPWILADVAIKDGHFVKIGLIAERGST